MALADITLNAVHFNESGNNTVCFCWFGIHERDHNQVEPSLQPNHLKLTAVPTKLSGFLSQLELELML